MKMGDVMLVIIAFGVVVLSKNLGQIKDILKENYTQSLPPVEEVRLISREKRMFEYYKEKCKEQLGPDFVSEYVDCAGQYMTQWMEEENGRDN